MVLGVVPLIATAAIWWVLLVLSWFPYCGVFFWLVHCWAFLYLFCCGSAEGFRFVVYGEAIGWVSFLHQESNLLHSFSFTLRRWAGLGVLVGVIASTVYPLLVPLK